ncbi:MAG: radical SAM protein [Alphaproteobacteria bacterium]
MTIDDAIAAAIDHHRAGRLAEAEALYRRILEVVPEHADALHLLGIIASQTDRVTEGLTLIEKAVAVAPDQPTFRTTLGRFNLARGQTLEAARSFGQAATMSGDGLAWLRMVDAAFADGRHLRDSELAGYLLRPPLALSRLQIEITTLCNLKCSQCQRTVDMEAGRWVDRHMSVADFTAIIDHCPPANVLVPQGTGEPTLHPHIAELVAVAHGSGKFRFVTINTNLLGHDVPFFLDLAAAGLNRLSVSIDSLAPDIAERCRSGTRVDKLLTRLERLAAVFKPLLISIVASRLNRDDIPTTLRTLNAMGLFGVEIQPVIDYREGPRDRSAALDDDEIVSLRRDIDDLTPQLPNLRITLAERGNGDSGARCGRPLAAPFVTVEGYLTPCCTVSDPTLLGLTSVTTQPFADAWSRPAVQAWLRSYFESSPSMCAECCFNPA